MKKLLLFFCVTVIVMSAVGQRKTELRVNLYSGFFSFHGNGSARTTGITAYMSDIAGLNLVTTDNVYGRSSGFPMSFEAQIMRIGNKGFLYGAAVSYDILRARVHIDSFVINNNIVPGKSEFDATGTTTLTNTCISVHPFVGKRVMLRRATLDFLGGLDLGFGLTSNEKGSAENILHTPSPPQIRLTTDNPVQYPVVDIRPRLQVQATVKRFGFLAGYSLGLTNYQTNGVTKAYSGFLRIGLGYRIL